MFTGILTTSLQRIVSASAPIARTIEKGLNIINQREAAATVHLIQHQLTQTLTTATQADQLLNQATSFINSATSQVSSFQTSAQDVLAGIVTQNEAQAATARVSNAPTIQDLQSAAAPQIRRRRSGR